MFAAPEVVREYRTHGAVVLRRVVPPPLLGHLDEIWGSEIVEGRGRGFARENKDIAVGDRMVVEFCLSSADALEEVVGYRPLLTQSLGFEIEPGSAGFPWHVDTGSFNFIAPQCRAFSLWIPLMEIDSDGGGGICYVSRQTADGADHYWNGLGQPGLARRGLRRMEYLWSRLVGRKPPMLDDLGVEPSFSRGDLLLIDKRVLHRTAVFRTGTQATRRAFTIRFVEERAEFAKAQYQRAMSRGGTYAMVNTFGANLMGLSEGEKLVKSDRCIRL